MPRSPTLYNVNPPLVPPHHSYNKPVTINHHSVFEMERRLKHLQLKLDKVVEGETQKDSSITYRLVLTVEEKGADTKDYTVVVVEENAKLHLKSFKKVVIKSESSHRAM
ncbi:hypothetical protein Tsubulata_024494 [Turnera subulata]|uniref:Cystatin domain-containing protein n=1 Tax=Turnera subulata TaxID=218843 RepID=A0A9Q0JQG8_9ROSI|nr:hypothetical protein Tsubulata_024494 [Turnera subulata]